MDNRKHIKSNKRRKGSEKPSVLILVNHDVVIYNFRLELVERLLNDGYEVHVSSPLGEHTEELIASGVYFHEIDINRHGMNVLDELHILNEYKRLINMIDPVIVLTYTVKPNVYGGIAARAARVPFIANITGLGTAVHSGGVKEAVVLFLYKLGLRGAQKVFFQNEENKTFMVERNIISSPYGVLPGSGVNLQVNNFEQYPKDSGGLIFITIGRIMKDKGTDELLAAARTVKAHHSKIKFRLIGFFDDDYEAAVKAAVQEGTVEYIEQQRDIHPWIKDAHAIIHPSYHEGMSNVLLEAAAAGRPILASNIPGCRETFDEGVSGLGFKPKSKDDLVRVIEAFITLPYKQKEAMGRAGRQKMEKDFNRQIVVERYMNEIAEIGAGN